MTEPTILVVDDERNIRRSLEMILSAEGYRVLCAASGTEALAAMRSESPQVALLDIVLPGSNGIEILKTARQSYPKPGRHHDIRSRDRPRRGRGDETGSL